MRRYVLRVATSYAFCAQYFFYSILFFIRTSSSRALSHGFLRQLTYFTARTFVIIRTLSRAYCVRMRVLSRLLSQIYREQIRFYRRQTDAVVVIVII